MPPLPDPRHEAFAEACSKGMDQKAAYVAAGFAASTSSGSRLAKTDPVRDRVAELRLKAERIRRAGLEETVNDLMAMADRAAAQSSAAAIREARLTRLEANRLVAGLRSSTHYSNPSRLAPGLSDEDWMAKYAPGGPGYIGHSAG